MPIKIAFFISILIVSGFFFNSAQAQTDTLNISWLKNPESDSVQYYSLYRIICNTLADTIHSNYTPDSIFAEGDTSFFKVIGDTIYYTDLTRNRINPGALISYRVSATNSEGSSILSNEAHAGIPKILENLFIEDTTRVKIKFKDFIFDPDDIDLDSINIEISNLDVNLDTNLVDSGTFEYEFVLRSNLNSYSFSVKAIDTRGFYDSVKVQIRIGDWALGEIPGDTIPQNRNFKDIYLDDYVVIYDTVSFSVDRISWSIFGNDKIEIDQNKLEQERIASLIVSDPNWIGNDTIIFIATDKSNQEHTESVTVIFKITSFSDCIVYPNPFRAASHTYMLFDGIPDEATEILIITPAQELVFKEDLRNLTSGLWQWSVVDDRGKPVASGFYIYVIKNGNKKIASGKIAVIR